MNPNRRASHRSDQRRWPLRPAAAYGREIATATDCCHAPES